MNTITAPAEESRRPQKITVRVTRNKNGQCEVKTKHALPTMPHIVRYFDKPSLKLLSEAGLYINNSTALSYVMECAREIKAKTWSAAIAKAIADVLSDRASVETELIATSGPAYLCMGNGLFELNAVEHIVTGEKALPALRRKVLSESKDEAERILSKATADAQKIVQDARHEKNRVEMTLNNARTEIRALRTEALASGVIPPWVRQNQLRVHFSQQYDMHSSNYLYVPAYEFECSITIKSFYHTILPPQTPGMTAAQIEQQSTKRIWKVPRPVTLKFPMIVQVNPLDGSYEKAQVGLIPKSRWTLPHMAVNRACMILGDLPPTITSIADLNKLIGGISRTMEEVNLDSLMCQPSQWHPSIRRKFPKVLRDWFAANVIYARNLSDLAEIPCDQTIEPTQQPIELTVEPDAPIATERDLNEAHPIEDDEDLEP